MSVSNASDRVKRCEKNVRTVFFRIIMIDLDAEDGMNRYIKWDIIQRLRNVPSSTILPENW